MFRDFERTSFMDGPLQLLTARDNKLQATNNKGETNTAIRTNLELYLVIMLIT